MGGLDTSSLKDKAHNIPDSCQSMRSLSSFIFLPLLLSPLQFI